MFLEIFKDNTCEPEIIKNTLNTIGFKKELYIKNSIPKAINYAKSIANKNDVICISGSLFTVGEARSYLVDTKKQIIRC